MSAVTVPRTAKGQATRARLIAGAREVAIARDGHVEIATVAEAAGVVPSLVHRYFGTRAGLVSALFDDFFERLHAEVLDLDLTGRGTWAQRERLRLGQGVRFHYTDPLAVVLYTRLPREPEVAKAENRHVEAVIGAAAANIRRGQRAGELPGSVDAGLAGAAMFGAMQRVMVAALASSPPPPAEHVIEILWRQVAAAVGIDVETIGREGTSS